MQQSTNEALRRRCGWALSLVALVFSSWAIAADNAASIKHGEYLARAGDCAACHTAPGGELYAGGLKMTTPVGAIYSSNITPDQKTGIGRYTLDDFTQALRKGIAKDGRHLYPAMPYPAFSKISDSDVGDLYQYFMHGVPAVDRANQQSDIPFPLNIRWPLAVWNRLFLDKGRYQSDPQKSPEWNRGAYLVQGLGHCGACHTPRGIAFEEKALDQHGTAYLSGGTLEGWHAANLRGDLRTGLGTWSADDISQFLQKGHTDKTAAFGSMVAVIQDSIQHLNDDDRHAIAVYLKSLPESGQEPKPQYNAQTYQALSKGDVLQPGAQVYLDNCSGCHLTTGKGEKNAFPQLAQNPDIISDDPSSLLQVILRGSHAPITQQSPTGLTMPGFADRLNDPQIADLANFIRNGWGNQATEVSISQVRAMRKLSEPVRGK